MTALPDMLTDHAPYSVARLAERWECSERLIYKLIERGDLQCFRPGSLIRISAAEVERFECQTTACSASGAASPSSIGSTASASEGNSRQRIARAPRRKPARSGKGQTVHRGPWGG